jgi:hypothetical protein
VPSGLEHGQFKRSRIPRATRSGARPGCSISATGPYRWKTATTANGGDAGTGPDERRVSFDVQSDGLPSRNQIDPDADHILPPVAVEPLVSEPASTAPL